MNEHMKKHDEKQPKFGCLFCNSKKTRLRDLFTHYKKKHNNHNEKKYHEILKEKY